MINLFEKTIQHLSDINVLNNKLISQTTKTKTALQQYSQSFGNEPEIELIEKAFNNILQNPEPFHSPYEFSIFQNNCWLVFKAVQIFSQSMVKYDTESRLFENSLFNVSFIPEDNYTNDIYSAYLLHDEIISAKSQICNIKSSFKCGKTHCLPIFLSIKAIQENMERPFIIMVLPSNNLIENTIQDFDDLLGDSVYLINDYTELESMYENLPKKPVICMFTIRLLFEILSNAEEKKFQIFKYSRFILDGIYQKNLDTEELIEKFTKEMKNYSFPLQLICMAPVSHPIILDSFDEVYEFDLPDYLQTVKTAPEDEQKNIDELIKIGALNSNKTLNKIGRDIAPFSSLPPFVSISILNVARKYENKTIASLVGCLAFLILNTNNIIIDANTDIFRRNFDENSDIITLMSSLLELIQLEGNLKKNLVDGGFNPSNCSEVIETIEKIAFYINDNDDDKKSIWNKISIFYKSNSMMSFIKKILNQIEEYRPDWISCRRCEFINVINVLKNYFIVYKGDKSLTEDRSQPEIKISMRPGGKGFAAPGTCFIMQIKCPDKINYYGSIIHRDLSRKEICHPSIIEASIMMNNVYTVPIIEGYIGDLRSEFRPFQKTMYNKGNLLGECICYPEQFGDKTIISYTSNKINDENTKKIIEEAIQKAQKIMPYTPRTILVKNDVIKAVVSVTSFGSKNFTTQIINYTDKNPIPYSVNKTTIDYLIDHINELNDVDGHLVIAITGEKFSYSINEEETFTGNPTTNPTIPCVFGMIPDFYSHLVVLSNKPIPNSKQLNWVDRKISVTYSDVDSFILVANTIYRGAVEVTHEYNMIYCLPQNSKINLDGQTSGSANSINEILDNLAVNCTNGSNLINRIDFRGFSSSKNINCLNLEKDIKGFNLFRKTYPNLNPFQLIEEGNNLIPNVHKLSDLYNEKNKLVDRIKEIKADMKKLSDSFNLPGANKHDIIIQQHEKKLFKESIQNDIDSLTNQINECKSKIKPFCDKYHIDEVIAQKLLSITSPKQILELPKVFVYNSYIEINTKVDECDKVLQIIKEYKSDLVTEVVPLCLINVSHRINSNICKSQFIQKINDVCKRFGSIVKIKDEYKETEKSRMNKGFIRISILKGEFAVPFVNEIHKAIGNDDNIILKIPTKIVPTCLLSRLNVIEVIEEWIRNQGLRLSKSGFKYSGSTNEVERSLKLLSKKETQPKIPFKPFTIPGGIEISRIFSAIKKMNCLLDPNSKWAINKETRVVYVPESIDDDIIHEFINNIDSKKTNRMKEDAIIYDYDLLCEDTATLSGQQMPLYQQDGSIKLYNYCTTCGYDLFMFQVTKLFDQEEDKPKMNLLCENVNLVKFVDLFDDSTNDAWPEIPLGQMLWCLVSEPVMNAVVKTWFSALIFQALHSSPLFDFCPNHPAFLMRNNKNGKMKCSQRGCKMYLCDACNKWHFPGACEKDKFKLPRGYRFCPGCKRPVEKSEACNHISCRCGKHFCYYCGWGPCDDSSPVYSHLSECHSGCFNNPPDYRKYCLHENVSDDELNNFYKQYPQFKID